MNIIKMNRSNENKDINSDINIDEKKKLIVDQLSYAIR